MKIECNRQIMPKIEEKKKIDKNRFSPNLRRLVPVTSSEPHTDSVNVSSQDEDQKHSSARSLCNAEPTLWNRLPDVLHKAKGIGSFLRLLKSY